MDASHALEQQPRKILVIALRYLGDVLLTTPLLHSLRLAYPTAQLDVLVYANTAGMLEGNPDIDSIITQSTKPQRKELWQLMGQLFRQYDLAISTQVGDRPILYSLLAAPLNLSPVPSSNEKGWWKRYCLKRWLTFDDINTHTVQQHLKLLDLLDVPKQYVLRPPKDDAYRLPLLLEQSNFVVLHVCPQWIYKRWTTAGWVEIGQYLSALGLRVVLSGGTAAAELAYIADIQKQLPTNTVNLAGQVSLAQLAVIITQARLFIGVDTGITHLAAATGVAVIALFGPTNPVKWAPWPSDYQSDVPPFAKVGSQHVNNVYLLQGEAACVPCYLEGCERHQQSQSDCLETLSPQRVIATINQIIQH